ncbi:MAG: OmpA family protein [Saprospiraceae bacterium]
MKYNTFIKLAGQIILCFLLPWITPISQAQSSIHFSPFIGTVYDVPGEYLTAGYSSHVAHYDEMGKTTLDSLNIPKTFVNGKYFPGVTMRTRFGIVFLSELEISDKGCYEFYLESDDGSKLWIRDSLIIDNDGPHKMFAKRDTVLLEQGHFPVKVWYYNAFESQYGLILRGRALPDTISCEPLQKTGTLRKMSLDVNAVLFDFNSFIITAAGMKALDNLCTQLDQVKFKTIHIIGYTDQAGTEAYNKELSMKRAQTISVYLKSKMHNPGISYKAEGRGASNPVNSGLESNEQQMNRRVEIFIE